MVVLVFFVAVAMIMTASIPAEAGGGGGHGGHAGHGGHGHFGHHSHVFVGVGVGSAVIWDPWWPYPPYAYAPPVVVQAPPPVYIEREPSPAQGSWYYCPSAKAYYPNVQSCGEPWVAVPPRAP
jgi:hypothetical protein